MAIEYPLQVIPCLGVHGVTVIKILDYRREQGPVRGPSSRGRSVMWLQRKYKDVMLTAIVMELAGMTGHLVQEHAGMECALKTECAGHM